MTGFSSGGGELKVGVTGSALQVTLEATGSGLPIKTETGTALFITPTGSALPVSIPGSVEVENTTSTALFITPTGSALPVSIVGSLSTNLSGSSFPANATLAREVLSLPVRDVTDKFIDMVAGKSTGCSTQRKFGSNGDVGNGDYEVVCQLGTSFNGFLTSSIEVRVKAGDADDDVAGAGAREITVVGLDENAFEVTESLDPAGASGGPLSTTTFTRVNRAFVSSAGTYNDANVGAVVIQTKGGVDLVQIAAEEGQSEVAFWTVPSGKTAYLKRVIISSESGSTDEANFKLYQRRSYRDATAPVKSKRIVSRFVGVSGFRDLQFDVPIDFPAETDIWMEAIDAGVGTIAVSVEMHFIILDD